MSSNQRTGLARFLQITDFLNRISMPTPHPSFTFAFWRLSAKFGAGHNAMREFLFNLKTLQYSQDGAND
jgi:hypothetical protein